jgi:hypothetical protein
MLNPLPMPPPPGTFSGLSTGVSYGTEDGLGPKTFHAACSHAARLLHGKLVEYHDSLADRDPLNPLPVGHREASLVYDFGRSRIRVLCNPPIIAFTRLEPERDPRTMTFLDVPALESALGEKLDGFVLRAADANRQPTPELIATLEESEKHAADYHRPRRMGEVFFNDWD